MLTDEGVGYLGSYTSLLWLHLVKTLNPNP